MGLELGTRESGAEAGKYVRLLCLEYGLRVVNSGSLAIARRDVRRLGQQLCCWADREARREECLGAGAMFAAACLCCESCGSDGDGNDCPICLCLDPSSAPVGRSDWALPVVLGATGRCMLSLHWARHAGRIGGAKECTARRTLLVALRRGTTLRSPNVMIGFLSRGCEECDRHGFVCL